MFYSNFRSIFVFFTLFPIVFVLAEDEKWPFIISPDISEVELRMKFLEKCPDSFIEMINYDGMENGKIVESTDSGTFAQNEGRRSALVNKDNAVWSNKSGTVNLGAGSTGNAFLDLLPPPARAVIIAAKFLKNFKQETSWIKKLFGIKPPMTVEACLCVIRKDPYTEKIFARIQDIHNYIYEVNSTNIITRIFARIKLLEVELPPPYDRRFKKAIKKFKKECANAEGDLVGNQEIVKVFNIFNSYLNEMLIVPERFIKRIPKLKKHKSYHPKIGMSSAVHREVVQLVENEPKMSFPRLTRFCKKHGAPVIKELYKHFVEKRIQRYQQKLQQDPQWNINQENKPTEEQVKLLLRSHYQKELEEWVSHKKIDSGAAKDETYHALDRAGLTDALPEGYHFGLLDNFIQNVCKGIDNCSSEIVQTFFHTSGVLKKYESNSFVQQYVLSKKLSSPQLHKALNYALAIQDKINTSCVRVACVEILLNSALALHSVDFKDFKMYEENAYNLYREIVNKKGKLSLKEVSADLIKEFNRLGINK